MLKAHSSDEVLFLAIGLAGGTVVGVGNYCVEHAGFALCHMLERRGTVSRLSKAKCPELKAHPSSNVWTVGTPYIPLYWLLARNWGGLHGFGNKMQVSFDVSYIFVFMWVAMVAHDAWFYLIHTLFHYVKPLYQHFHRLHHSNGSNISSLGTAYGDAVDIGSCFVAFHALIYFALSQAGFWNLPAVVALISFEVATNVAGHCGYELPLWAHALLTGGVGLTPYSATSRTHYIHHLDPRVNKSLYFTWWDRLADTYTDEHVLCQPPPK